MMLPVAGCLHTLPSEGGALACPMRMDAISSIRSNKGTAKAVLGQPGCINPSSKVDFAIPAGAKAFRFSEGTRCSVGRAEVSEAGSTGALVPLKYTKQPETLSSFPTGLGHNSIYGNLL